MMERITSRQNPYLQHVKKLQSSSNYRREQGQFVGDGIKLLQEALRWYPYVETVIVSEGVELPPMANSIRAIIVPADVMQSISQMKAPQGALFVCKKPEPVPPVLADKTLVLEGLQDPGNLGTILRTADAFGAQVVLLEGCADPFQPKVVRASMGAMFRGQPLELTTQEFVNQAKSQELPIIATALMDSAVDIRNENLTRAAVIIGSEGGGISQNLLELADRAVIIPMGEQCESLNAAVAATVVMWKMLTG